MRNTAENSVDIPKVVAKFFIGDNRNQCYDHAVYEPTTDMFQVIQDGKVGFADRSGNLVIPAIYDIPFNKREEYITYPGENGFIFLKKDSKYGVILKDGTVTVDFKWNDIAYIIDDIVCVETTDADNGSRLFGFVNIRTGKILYKPAFSSIGFIEDYYCEVGIPEKDDFALLDLITFTVLTDYRYFEIGKFVNGCAPVCVNNRWGLILENGFEMVKPRYGSPIVFKNNYAIVSKDIFIKNRISELEMDLTYDCVNVLLNNKGIELVNSIRSNWKAIHRIGSNIFLLKGFSCKKKVIYSLRQFFEFRDFTFVIEDGRYIFADVVHEKGGKFSVFREDIYIGKDKHKVYGFKTLKYMHSLHYIGGGTFYVLNRKGKKVDLLSSEQVKQLRNAIIYTSARKLERSGIKMHFKKF